MRQPVPFGKYLLLDRISVGGMAEVFKAKSYGVEGFEKIIAIKRILPTMGEDRDFIKMFIDEAKIAGQLAHANICQIFELGRIDGSHFIAMEYIWGKDLLQIQNRLRKLKQPMPISMACFSIAKVLEGLDYAHRKRDPLGRPLEIVHRDCSPQNVLVSYEGEVKVIDFGIAKATSRNSRTMAGVLKGKFGYMSPEQVRGLPLDRRSDIFALGTMLYECLTGDRLFQGETDFSTLEKVRNVDIRPPREVNPDIPPAVEAVILKALSKDVDERYQWCSEMLADLQAFLMSQDVVFTAKSLSGWLKEMFAAEIDRERQLLEEYKRLGRDGLFAGVPAASVKADVVASLGEAPPVEGDPTTLGGPNFEDLEAAAAASAAPAEVGPAPGSPAARGAPPAPADDDVADAFGEEAPTEIFGEINHGANPAAALPPSPPAPAPVPQTRPPRPPPNVRPPTSHDRSPAAPGLPLPDVPSAPIAAPPGISPYQQYVQPPSAAGMSSPPGPQSTGLAPTGSQPIALGTPGVVALPPNAAQARTLIGQQAPNYAQGYPQQYGQYSNPANPANSANPANQPPQRPSGSIQAPGMGPPGTQPGMLGMPPQGMPMQHPQGMYPQGMQPQPGMQPPGMQPYPGAAYPMPHNPYGQPAMTGVGPVEQASLGKRKSSIARDVGIGVAIAALVLGGFLVVKFLILNNDAPSEASAPPSSIATIHLAMTPGVTADLFVDDKKVATVVDKLEIPVTAGQRRVKLVGPGGAGCEQEMTLAAGKTTMLECAMNLGRGSAAGSGAPPAGAAPGSGSAVDSAATGSGAAAGSGAAVGSGSAAGSAAADKMPPEEPAKPAEVSAAAASVPSTAPAEPEKAAVKVPEKAVAKTPERPVEKVATKAAEKTTSKAADKPAEKSRSRASADDDPLGSLQGGAKPLDKNQLAKRAAADGKGFLTVTSKPAARIYVDNVDTGLSTPISGRSLPIAAGKHKVTFAVGGDKFTFAIAVKPGETVALHKDLQ